MTFIYTIITLIDACQLSSPTL